MPQAPNSEIPLNIPQKGFRKSLEGPDRKIRELQGKAVSLSSHSSRVVLKGELEQWVEGYLAALRDVRRILKGKRDEELKKLF